MSLLVLAFIIRHDAEACGVINEAFSETLIRLVQRQQEISSRLYFQHSNTHVLRHASRLNKSCRLS